MAAKLKVFVTSDGLTEYAVATTSRPKALAAWGVHQDLFVQGVARETDDPALVKAATDRPGEVIERRSGAKVQIPKARRPVKRGPSKAALKKVADLEQALEALDLSHQEQLKALAAQERYYEGERGRLTARLSKARAAAKA